MHHSPTLERTLPARPAEPRRVATTPGRWGYAAAVLASLAAFAVLLPLPTLLVAGTDEYLHAVGWVLGYGVWLAAPMGALGVLVVHLLCADEPRQAVHAFIAGCLGLAIGVAFFGPVLDGDRYLWPALSLAAATALGRAAVVPLVHRRTR